MFTPLGGHPQTQRLSRLAVARKPCVYPAWRAQNPEPCTERIPSPACGGRGFHEKNARIFFMGTREGGRRPEGGIQTQCLPRLAVTHKPSIYPAWRPPANPVFIPLGALPFLQTQRLSRLVAANEPSVYPAWQQLTNPAFTPLGSSSRTQCLSRLAVARKPSVYPAWQQLTNPAFTPLGALLFLQTQRLSRLAATHKPSIYPAWRLATSPVFTPLGGLPRTQCLPRLAARHEPSIYPAWRLPINPAFIPLGAHPIQNLARKNPVPRLRGTGLP